MTPIGDIARNTILQNQTRNLRSLIQVKTDELATGRVSKLREHLNGETGQLRALQSDQNLLQAYKTNINEVQTIFGAQQRGLDQVRSILANLADAALSFQNEDGVQPPLQVIARQSFDTVVSLFNSNIGGRTVFNQGSADTDPNQLFTQIGAALAAQPDQPPLDVARSVIQQAIDPENSEPQAPVPVAPNQSVSTNDPSIQPQFSDILSSLSLLALGRSGETAPERQDIATNVLQMQDQLVSTQANIGQREDRLDSVLSQNASEHEALEFLRNELTAADPYEAATQLQTATLRLETLLAATARISKLSLTNYL